MTTLESPTKNLIAKYLEKFKNDKRYNTGDQAILKLFNVFPENKKIEDILLKISVINDLYSTNIFGTYKMAEHILRRGIDEKLKNGDSSVVNDIARGHEIRTKKNNTELNFYSFSTKYCSWHNQNDYAIYDSFVEKILMAYQRQNKFSSFTKNDLKNFEKFKSVIKDFTMYYNLTEYSLKEIDKFLWIYGKEKFPSYNII